MGLALCVLGISPAGQAVAGAFNQPEGHGVAIMDVTFSGGSRYFNGLGKLAPSATFQRGDGSVYVEL